MVARLADMFRVRAALPSVEEPINNLFLTGFYQLDSITEASISDEAQRGTSKGSKTGRMWIPKGNRQESELWVLLHRTISSENSVLVMQHVLSLHRDVVSGLAFLWYFRCLL